MINKFKGALFGISIVLFFLLAGGLVAQNDTKTGRVWGPNATFTGIAQFSRFISTVATGTAPFTVASTTLVANLHAATADNAASVTPPISLSTSYLSETRVVTAALTTTAGLLVKTATTGNTVSTAAIADTGAGGIAITSQTAGQNVEIAVKGVANCIADNTTVIGDLIVVGTVTAGRCKDSGKVSAITISDQLQIIGRALSVATVGNPVLVQIFSQGIYGTLTGVTGPITNTAGVIGFNNATLTTATNCTSAASPAVCGSAAAGAVEVAVGATTVVVNTSAITANSEILVTDSPYLSTRLAATCNATIALPTVTAISAGVSFTITIPVAPITNPACYSWVAVN